MIMNGNSVVRPVTGGVFTALVLACAVLCGAAEEDSRWVHPLCQPLAVDSNGPFVELADGSLMTIDVQGTRVSQDDGKTWSERQNVCEGLDGLREGREPASSAVVRTQGGALVIVYLDSTTYNFSWDRTIDQPKDDCRLEIWAIRSLDGGKTWIDRQRILEGYNPNFFGFIQTRGGRLVATVPHLVRDPGRYVACSLTSDDDGKTWKRSNLVDLGGHGRPLGRDGAHGGRTERRPAVDADSHPLGPFLGGVLRRWRPVVADRPAESDRIDQRRASCSSCAAAGWLSSRTTRLGVPICCWRFPKTTARPGRSRSSLPARWTAS